MTPSQALFEIEKFYVPGCAEYYDGFKSNPWQKAHDDFEAAVLTNNWDLKNIASEVFIKTLKELVKKFKEDGEPAKQISMHDAFTLGSEKALSNFESVIYEQCAECESKENLTFESTENDLFVKIICKECKK